MARPSRATEEELAQLENLAALLATMADDRTLLTLRLDQARQYIDQAARRARGQPYLQPVLDRLREVVEPAHGEVSQLQAAVADAQQILSAILEAKQNQRTLQNNGGK